MCKVCPKCEIEKSYTEFSKKDSKDGLQYSCKECFKVINSNWRKSNPEKHRAKAAKWQKDNPEKAKARNAKWRKNNPEKDRDRAAKWRKNNPEKDRAKAAKWQKDNPERYRANVAKWQKDNPEKCKLYRVKRRARKLGATSGYMPEWTERVLFGMQEEKCLYCRIDLKLSGIHLEHMVPLSRGGNHNIMNLCLSCPPCNQRKYVMTAEEFITNAS